MLTLAELRLVLERVAELPAADRADAIGLVAAAQARLLTLLVMPPNAVPADSDRLVDAETLAERFSLSISTVHELARAGQIPCKMFGRYRRFNLAEVAAAGGFNLGELGIDGRKALQRREFRAQRGSRSPAQSPQGGI